MDGEVMVSVVCLAYNHEKYIRHTLEGFVSQKTSFPFEVVIHDDASKDNTAAIIREYAEKYPNIIRPIYQTQNQHSQKKPIHKLYTIPLVRGKYVALCEGDDYWTDTQKLQKQFDIMENNPDYSICTHKIQEILESGEKTDRYRPNISLIEGKISVGDFLKIQKHYPFQTASYFMKASLWKSLIQDPPTFRRAADVGDEPMLLYMLAHGDLYYLPDCMSVYRVCSIGSWSYQNQNDFSRKAKHAQKMYEMMCLYDEYTNHKYDCNLSLYRGRMLLYNKEFKELLKKENRAYVKQLSFKKRSYIRVCAMFPFLGRYMK